MKQAIEYLKELFEEPLNLEEGSIEYDFLKVLKKAQLEFAINVLEDLNTKMSFPNQVILDKIQELKTQLDERDTN